MKPSEMNRDQLKDALREYRDEFCWTLQINLRATTEEMRIELARLRRLEAASEKDYNSYDVEALQTRAYPICELPFIGTYQGIFSMDDNELYHDGDTNQPFTPDENSYVWEHFCFDSFMQATTKAYVKVYQSELDYLMQARLCGDFTPNELMLFESYTTPKDYASGCDRIFVYLHPQTVDILGQFAFNQQLPAFTKYVRQAYTSYSGFIPNCPKDVNKWLAKKVFSNDGRMIHNFDHCELMTLLTFYTYHQDKALEVTLERGYRSYQQFIRCERENSFLNEVGRR